MCESNPQGYNFTGVFRKLAERKAEATYKFEGVLEVMYIRAYKAKKAAECPECRQRMRYAAQAQMAAARATQNPGGLVNLGARQLAGMGSPFGRY